MLAFTLALALPQGRIDRAPALGTPAPAVVGQIVDSKENFDLAQNRGKRPTVLIFGSCT